MSNKNVVRFVAPQTSAVDLVLHEIRRSILTGALAPGEPIVVQSLTEQLGVSHVPVREALRQLQSQGLLRLSRAKSAVVAPLNLADLESIYRLRLCMEPELAAQSTVDRAGAELARLKAVAEAMYEQQDTESVWDLHREFHTLLITPAAGEWGLRFLNQLWDATERYSRLTFDPVDAPAEDRHVRRQAHYGLLEAAHSRNPEKVYNEIRSHLLANEATITDRLQAVAARS